MGNAVRYKKPTRRKNPLKVLITFIIFIIILSIAGYFAYINFTPDKADVQKPEIIYIVEE